MNNAEKQVLRGILDCATEIFLYRGYKKFPKNFWDNITPEEKKDFLDEYHDWNGIGSNEEDVDLDMITWYMDSRLKEIL